MYKFLRCLNCLYYVKKSYSFCIHSFIHPVGHVFHHCTMLPGAMLRLGYMMTITDTVTVLQTVVMLHLQRSFVTLFVWLLDSLSHCCRNVSLILDIILLHHCYYLDTIILFLYHFSAILRMNFLKKLPSNISTSKTSGHQNFQNQIS